LGKAEDNDTDALKLQSIKTSKSLPECPTITALVGAFDSKGFSDTELLKSYLDGGNRIINFCRQINRKCLGQIFEKTQGLHFLCFMSVLSYLFLKNQTYSTYVWRRKVVKAQREDHFAI